MRFVFKVEPASDWASQWSPGHCLPWWGKRLPAWQRPLAGPEDGPRTAFPDTGAWFGLLDLPGSAEEEIPYTTSQTLHSLLDLSFHLAVTTAYGGFWVYRF